MTDETLLLRQVHPAWCQNDRVTSQAFRPTAKDQQKLSVYDGDQISAERAWLHYTGVLQLSSVGVLAISKRECDELHLPVTPDPEPFPEHVVIDFVGLTNAAVTNHAKRLRVVAESRGWQYRAASSA